MRAATRRCLLLAATVLPALTAQAQNPDELEIVVGRAGLDTYGAFVNIAGEIHNNSQEWVCAPQIDVELFDPAGQPITITSIVTATREELGQGSRDGCVADREWLPPGEVAVFEYLRDVKKLGGAKYGSYKLSAHARTCPNTRPKIAVEGFKAWKKDPSDPEWYTVSGTLKNVGSVPCYSVKAVIGMYSADGKLSQAMDETPDATFQKKLAPGQSVAFKIESVQSPDKTAADFKVWGDCGIEP